MTTGWHHGKMLAFDTETTGVDVWTDRIVSAHVEIIEDGVPVRGKSWLIDPGIAIPPEATKVHKITDEQVQRHGMPPAVGLAEITDSLTWAFASGIPVVGWYIPYDLTMLSVELARWNLPPILHYRPVVCGLALDKWQHPYRKGSRKLVDVAPLYGVDLSADDAHGAKADAIAAGLTIYAMAEKYPGIREHEIGELHDRLVIEAESQARSFEQYKRRTDPSFVGETGWPIRRKAS